MELKALDTGSGPAALLLHGQPGTAAHWAPVTERLRERMRVLAPDRPGYGRTGGSAVGFRENAEAAVELLDRLEVESAVVSGHSWGAGVALALASRFPERVGALVLVAPLAPRPRPDLVDRAAAHRRFGPAATRLGFLAAGLVLTLPPARRLVGVGIPGLEDQVEAAAGEWRGDAVWRSFYAEQRALVDELPTLVPELPSIQTPTIVLAGGWDLVTPPSHAGALAEALPDARLVTAKRAGHLLPQRHAAIVAKTIARAAGTRQDPTTS